jgi:hypothetical protein
MNAVNNSDTIRFEDIAAALRDARRFRWILPLIDGRDHSDLTEVRGRALYAAYCLGLRGVQMVDQAMEQCA